MARLLIAAAVLLTLAVGPRALGAADVDGDIRATFDGGIAPRELPRSTPVPVGVRVAGNFATLSGEPERLAQLRGIEVAINRQGRLFDRGLPTCDPRSIQPATEREARRICRAAVVGSGHVKVQVRIPTQTPFLVPARLLVFNGPRVDGHKLIYAQAYARTPPGSFVITFRVAHRAGQYGTVLSTTLPQSTREWAYLTHFDMTLRRTYTYRGERHSYVSAACAAPPGFSRAVFPFARATYVFAGGHRLSMAETGVCRVKAPPAG